MSLRSDTPGTLKEIYYSLYRWLRDAGYEVRQQNVSVAVNLDGVRVDVTPARRQPRALSTHSVFVSKSGTWTQTNVHKHVGLIKNCARRPEIILAKVWRQCHGLDFPSFYLELSVLRALGGRPHRRLDRDFWRFLEYLACEFVDARIVDPSNTANVVSDTLTDEEKQAIALKARACLGATTWDRILW